MNASCALSPIADHASQWPASGDRLVLKLLEPESNPQDVVLVPSPVALEGPLVSCLMVSRGRLLPARHAIECFRRQTYRRRELVIIDDNPASELREFLAVMDDPLIRHVMLPASQGSLGSLRNRALAESRGDLVCQWDDDDLYDARRIAWQVEALQTSGAQACFLRRWTLWWPAERRIAVSGERIWEGSMLAQRTAVPTYPDQRRGEDSVLTGQIIADKRVVLMNAPELYCYTIHGGNTFHYQHFLGIYNAASEFAGRHAYANYLQLLGRRLPILNYAVALEQAGNLAAYRRPQPVPLPDRFIDPSRQRSGRTPSCSEPRVSIVVRSMGRNCLADALSSLAAQSYSKLEVVVVDATGGRHPPLPATIAADVRFRLVCAGRPLKRSAAANFGLEAATGEYLGFLDDDDLFDPEHVALLVRRILEPDHPDLVYAGLWLVDRYHRLCRRQCNPFNTLMFQFFNLIPAISVLFHRRVIELGCRFDESLEVFEDWDFWLQLAPHVRIERIEVPTQYYFIEAGTSGCSIGLNADSARAGHYSKRVRQRWQPCSSTLWREYTALVHDLLARFHDGERAELRPAMRALLGRYPEEPNIEFHLGRSYLAEGHVFSARRLYESAVSHNRSCPEFILSLARLWEAQGSLEDALSCLEEARPALSKQMQVVDAEITRLRRLIISRQTFPGNGAGGGRIGRNELCSCGSGARYKHCCGHQSARLELAAANQSLQAECDRLQVAGIEQYRCGELPAAGEYLAAANALLSGQPMVNHALALLAYDQGALDEAARYADVALAATTDPVITNFHRQLNYRRRRIAEAQLLREALRVSGRLLSSDGVRLALESAQAMLVLRCNVHLPLVEVDFNGWQGRVHFFQSDIEGLPDVALSTWPEQGGVLVIDGVPEVLPPLLDSQLCTQVLMRVTRDCPAMLFEIAHAVPGGIGLVYPDDITARQVGLPGFVLRPTLPPAAFEIARPSPGIPFRVGLRGSCEVDGLHPLDAVLIRRLLASRLSVSVHGGTPLLRHFPPSALPSGLQLHGFDASQEDFFANIDCLVLRRAPLASGEAALGFVAGALAAGCPLICADGLPGAELIMDGRNGFLVAAGDETTICERIALLRQDAKLMQSISEEARATARRYWAVQDLGRWTCVHMGLEV
ncbi:glycosyltransferase [Candidatus Nitrotoga arctica]|uniref:Glycosyltransferase 2-like domain-containing protein n=1 Tax=Candidatus Nitrotoga arctica TaxID=453162 RepID=A0ABM8YY42_9PROT|nr:glycosyltransferase [Candidatus Nitrotoga arctica]CAG9932459.1 conserved protein of unknown function [Candidatus Nitrotoga arctica]